MNVSIPDDTVVTVKRDDGTSFTITENSLKTDIKLQIRSIWENIMLTYTTILPSNVQSVIGNVNVSNSYRI